LKEKKNRKRKRKSNEIRIKEIIKTRRKKENRLKYI